MTKRAIMWFRRDLRLSDHPALLAAIENSDEIVPVFILDPKQNSKSGGKRLAYMVNSIRALDESLGNNLHVYRADQVEVLKELMARYNATEVHISKEYEPYGAARDERVRGGGDLGQEAGFQGCKISHGSQLQPLSSRGEGAPRCKLCSGRFTGLKMRLASACRRRASRIRRAPRAPCQRWP